MLDDFHRDYRAYREVVFRALVKHNPGFSGSKGRLVRLTQRLLDRCLFVLFCEDSAPRSPRDGLRDLLESASTRHEAAAPLWLDIQRRFCALRDRSPFGGERPRALGGLFADDPELESLSIPDELFCRRGQGAAAALRDEHQGTLLSLASRYSFGAPSPPRRLLTPRTLGSLFEQSITDHEILEARAEGRPPSAPRKRKRGGVYYTPEPIARFVVLHTLGPRLSELRASCGVSCEARAAAGRDADSARAYLAGLDAYERQLRDVKVLDPACGAGAFLLSALRFLVEARAWVEDERARLAAPHGPLDRRALASEVLWHNLYGVDIDAESVEIARLVLWLEAAPPAPSQASLDRSLCSGNTLVGPDFYRSERAARLSSESRERVRAVDWEAAFPEVFGRAGERRGFDCVIGNPPYIKSQNFRQIAPEIADYLGEALHDDGSTSRYQSARGKNFDLYLAFIEKSLSLLNREGVMGLVAPSVWARNEHGEPLRRLIQRTRALDRWVDFKNFQVFDGAATYTALQFFRGSPVDAVRCVFAQDGALDGIRWSEPGAIIPYESLADEGGWLLLPAPERDLILRLRRSCPSLRRAAQAIIVGLQTSADAIFHLERLAPGRYRSFAVCKGGIEVGIEDDLTRPLVSGPEAKRYQTPATRLHLLFPYGGPPGQAPSLLAAAELAERFPAGWAYLRAHEATLRARENGAFDDDRWYRFGRAQNIDKQHLPKLGVAQTVPEMRVFFDSAGSFCLNNVRVNGILVDDEPTGWFLLGALNGRVADFVFRRIAKPKEGGYFEANKQFIAPLPIPPATGAQKAEVAARARLLQRLHTERRDARRASSGRLDATIAEAERALNTLLFSLYGLSGDEISLVSR